MQTLEMRKFLAPEFIIGLEVRKLAGQYLSNFGVLNCFIVTDPEVRKQPWFQDILASLVERSISYTIFDKVSPNPQDIEVMEGAEIYRKESCRGILAIGGGSPIDCAKGIGIVSSNGGHILDYEGVDEVRVALPPVVCIPTTSGTSADVSQFSIIRDMQRLIKIAIISKAIVPDISLIDPLVTFSMDKYLTACTGLDALTHAVEAFVSNANSPITDNHALHAIALIRDNLKQAVENPRDEQSRYNMMIGSLEAGLAFSNASLGAVHAMAHSLGGYYDFAHGECNALLINHVLNYNFESASERYSQIGQMFDVQLKGMTTNEKRKAVFKAIQNFKNSVGIDYSLSKIGVKPSDTNMLSKYSVKDPCILTNPRSAKSDDIRVIFEEAM